MNWIRFVAFFTMMQPRWMTSLRVNMVRSFLRRSYGLSTLRRDESRMDRNEHESNNTMIENTVRSFLIESCLVQPHSYILLSVSGGVDSMAMLHIMAAIGHQSSNLPLDLAVVSFNHKLRPESDEEVAFVSSWATKYELPFYEYTLPVEKRNLVGLQARTREWRRKECVSILQAKNELKLRKNITIGSPPGCVYATAHHADDQMETMMLKLLRGAFISNLQPMSPRSDCGRVIHPLLPLSKEQIEAYMTSNKWTWYEDSSNSERKYKRNMVRLDVIPAMEKIAGGSVALRKRFDALAEQSAELEEWIDRETTSYLSQHHPEILLSTTMHFNDALSSIDTTHPWKGVLRLNVHKESPFVKLPSSLVQCEVLRRLWQYCIYNTNISEFNRNNDQGTPGTGSYDMIRALLGLAVNDLPLGMKDKRLQLHDDLIAIKIGSELRIEHTLPLKKKRNCDMDTLLEIHCHGVIVRYPHDMQVSVVPVEKESTTGMVKDSLIISSSDGSNIMESPFTMIPYSTTGESPSSNSVSITLYNLPTDTNLRIRYPQNGDRFIPPTKNRSVRVVEFLRHAAIPLHVRNTVPLIVMESESFHQENQGASDTGDDRNRTTISESVSSMDGNAMVISIPPYVTGRYKQDNEHEHTNAIRITITR